MIKKFKLFENVSEKIFISELKNQMPSNEILPYLENRLVGRYINVDEDNGKKPVSDLQNFLVNEVGGTPTTLLLNTKYGLYNGDVITIISGKKKKIKNIEHDPFEEEIWWEDVEED